MVNVPSNQIPLNLHPWSLPFVLPSHPKSNLLSLKMSTFDNQLLHSVLSGSVTDNTAQRMPKVGEIGGSAEDSRHSTQDGEDPLSASKTLAPARVSSTLILKCYPGPVPPYEEIEGAQSQQPAALQAIPPPQPQSQQQHLSPQVEGADGMIIADSELGASTHDSQSSGRLHR